MKHLILLGILSVLLLNHFSINGQIITIPDDYETIQAGIDTANNGDTVLVLPGTYFRSEEHTSELQSH